MDDADSVVIVFWVHTILSVASYMTHENYQPVWWRKQTNCDSIIAVVSGITFLSYVFSIMFVYPVVMTVFYDTGMFTMMVMVVLSCLRWYSVLFLHTS